MSQARSPFPPFILMPLEHFHGNRVEYVAHIRHEQKCATDSQHALIQSDIADYIIKMIPKFKRDHNELVAEFQSYEFNKRVKHEYILDNIREIYTVKDLMKQLKYAGMTKDEIEMVLAEIYEECFLVNMTKNCEQTNHITLKFRGYGDAPMMIVLDWSKGYFYTRPIGRRLRFQPKPI